MNTKQIAHFKVTLLKKKSYVEEVELNKMNWGFHKGHMFEKVCIKTK